MLVEQMTAYKNAEKILKDFNADGVIIDLIWSKKEDIQNAKEWINDIDDSRIVLVVPDESLKIEEDLKEYKAISYLKEDVEFLKEDAAIESQLEILLDDVREKIVKYINNSYNINDKMCSVYIDNEERKQLKPYELSRILSEICEKNYYNSPIINNELINKNEISAPIKKARNIIVDMLLDDSYLDFKYDKNAVECTLFRATIVNKGLLENERNFKADMKPLLGKIKEFIISADKKEMNFSALYNEVTTNANKLRARRGVLPIYLAYVLSRRNEDIVVYFNSMEIELNADRIVGMCENPEDFSVFVSKKEADKELYLTELQKLFSIPENRITKDNRISITAEYIKKWYRALPQISRNMVNPAGYEVVTKQLKVIKKARKILQTIECNPYEFLFNDLVELFDKKDLNTALVGIKDIKYCYDNYYQWSIDKACEVIIKTIDNRSKKYIYHTLKEWYETQNDMAKQGLFNGRITNFMTCIENINTFDESEITKKIVKAVSDVYIEDWNDSSLAEFKDSLVAILQEISKIKDEEKVYSKKNKLSFIGVNNNIVERYYEPVGEEKGAVFRNIIEDTIEQFEDELSVNDQVAIMLEMIEKMMK